MQMIRFNTKKITRILSLLALSSLVALTPVQVQALGSQDSTQSDSMGLEGRISSPPPTQAATITTPSSGRAFSDTPITVAGLCKSGLLVKVFSNNVFVGAVTCTGGSYSLQAALFSGRNDLIARVYDSLDQAGPDSNMVSVIFNDAQFAEFGSHVSLTSVYARRGANPGSELTWPIIISGGVGPYAVSVDWGDSTGTDLSSRSFADTFDIAHTYEAAGIYNVIIRASDSNGTSAYLQLVGVANGDAGSAGIGTTSNSGTTHSRTITTFGIYAWIPMLLSIVLIAVSFWLGRRHELHTIRRRIEESRQISD